MQRSSVEPLLRRLALRCLAALLLGVAAARATEFQESDFVPAARRAQFHGVRLHPPPPAVAAAWMHSSRQPCTRLPPYCNPLPKEHESIMDAQLAAPAAAHP